MTTIWGISMYKNNYLASRLRIASISHNDAPFLTVVDSGSVVTYGTFFENAERMAAALTGLGVSPGDRVSVQAPKTVEMLELYFGCVLAGAVFLPLNTAYTSHEIEYFLSDATPKILVCDPENLIDLRPVARSCGIEHILTLGADGSGSLRDIRNLKEPGFTPVDRAGEDLAAILYTSGTTGRSKGAMLSHRALASNSQTLCDLWQFTRDDTLIHALPIYHTHGLFVATNITLMAGGSMQFLTRFDPEQVLKVMPNSSAMMGVPTFYTRLLHCDGLQSATRNMRLFVSGSAPLLAETHDLWRQTTGHAILERYGMTETNMNASNPYGAVRRAGTVGFPLPAVELKICNPEGEEVAKGEIGVIEVRGPNLFSGYWNMPDKTAEELRQNGYFITGDLGRIDSNGYVQIVGRAKDLIISGGLNVYPKEIETFIDDLPGVRESAVIGVAHHDFGEAVVAVVVAIDINPETADLISGACADNLAKFKQPKAIKIVSALPRNTMGKVQKAQLRTQYRDLFA